MGHGLLLTVGVAALLAATGCGSSSHVAATHAESFPRGKTRLGQPEPSPDGKLVARVKDISTNHGPFGYLLVGSPKNGAQKVVYWSRDACCSDPVWASNRLLVFVDDYRTQTVDVTTGRIRTIAGFSNFTVSKDGRWVAGWAAGGPYTPQVVGVVSIDGRECRNVPKPSKNLNDWAPEFSPDSKAITFQRQHISNQTGDYGPIRDVTIPVAALLHAPENCL